MIDWDNWILEVAGPGFTLNRWQQNIDLMTRLFHAPAGFIIQYTSHGGQVVVASQQETTPYPTGSFIPADTLTLGKLVVQQKREIYIPNTHSEPGWDRYPEVVSEGFSSFLGLPIYWPNGMPFGTLCVMDFTPTDYREPYFQLLESFKDKIETDLQLLVSDIELDDLTLVDDLTGVYNRRGFDTLAQYKLSVAKRYGHTFGLMYFDLDNLHTINDQLGVEIGDMALQALADALGSELRDSDIAARIGDDEFAALVFVHGSDDLENLAIRIQKRLNLLKQHRDSMPPLTTSVGAKCYQADTKLDISTMLYEVDQLMFNIKQQKKLVRAPGHIPHH